MPLATTLDDGHVREAHGKVLYARLKDVSRKAWFYLVEALERPSECPFVLRQVAKGVHLGELLKLNRHKTWLQEAGVRTVIDIGAHAGEFSSAIRAILPSARIVAFEPQPEPYARLVRKFRGDSRFTACNVALGDRKGTTDFWESSFTKSSSVLKMDRLHRDAFPWSSELRQTSVEMDTLDARAVALDLQPAILLKIDVQGYEHQVLKGALETLKRVDIVIAEVSFEPLYEDQGSFQEVYELLSAKGFSYMGSMDTMQSPLDQSIMQEDAVFVSTRRPS